MDYNDIIVSVIATSLIILVLLAIMAAVFVISARRKLSQEMLLAETKLQFEQELRLVEHEVSEQLMSRLAQELHDNIGQLHTAMHMKIENQKLDHPEMKEQLSAIEIYLTEASRQLKILSRTLNYDYLGRAGLMSSIELEVLRLKEIKGLKISFNKTGSLSHITKNQELVVFRIFQEVVQNALRHSGASEIELKLDCEEEDFNFYISDNGKGFDVDATLKNPTTNGLHNIFKRAEMADLNIKVVSTPGKGTRYLIKKSHL